MPKLDGRRQTHRQAETDRGTASQTDKQTEVAGHQVNGFPSFAEIHSV